MPRTRQSGFTLLELMLASTLGVVLLIAALGIFYDSANIADVLRSRVSLNAAARESFDLLLDGGFSGGDEVFGLRGLGTAPPATELQVSGGNRVRLLNNGASTALEGPRAPPRTVACTGPEEPIPYCVGAGALAVEGYLGGEPVLNAARSIANRTRELELPLFNPYLVGRRDVATQRASEVYRTIFMVNPD